MTTTQAPVLDLAALVDGVELPGGGDVLDVVSPATGLVVARVRETTSEQVQQAIAVARQAQQPWGLLDPAERASVLDRFADLVEEESEVLALEVSQEMGMPLGLARVTQGSLPAAVLRSTARTAREFAWTSEQRGYTVHHVAAGVVAAITPWNMPVYQAVAKIAPALAAGCSVVLKPSELSPSATLRLARLAHRAGVPAAALGVVLGRGPVTGEALVTGDVDVVSFTGSVGAGRRVGALAAQDVKRVTLELGGKSAAVVLDDADLADVVPKAVRAAFLNSGQACNAATRLVVPRERLAEVEQLASAAASSLAVGDPSDPGTDLGPLVSRLQRDRVLEHVRRALDEGARLVVGDAHSASEAPYVAPVVLSDVAPESAVAQEEVFGPVLCLLAHDGDADAVRIANATRYGLSAEIWSRDPSRIAAVAAGLRAGQVKVNGVRTRERPDAPFGGFGLSGVGRELGGWGLQEFLEVKAVLA